MFLFCGIGFFILAGLDLWWYRRDLKRCHTPNVWCVDRKTNRLLQRRPALCMLACLVPGGQVREGVNLGVNLDNVSFLPDAVIGQPMGLSSNNVEANYIVPDRRGRRLVIPKIAFLLSSIGLSDAGQSVESGFRCEPDTTKPVCFLDKQIQQA